jgi:anaerobic selenocysteine-containing dehydrogenase
MSAREVAAALLKGGKGPTALAPEAVFEGRPISYAQPGGQRFATPSGKLEFYSEQLAAQGLPPMPDWTPDAEDAAQAKKWPLRLLTAPGYFQAHTAYAGVAFLRKREGEPICILHPEDAAARALADGQPVKLVNDLGAIGLTLRVSDEVRPGVVLVPGQRPDDEAVSGTINMLCSDRYTDIGEGATYQSTWLDVQAWAA